MPGPEVWWRLVGERARAVDPGTIVPIGDYLMARRPGAGFVVAGSSQQAYRSHVHFNIDPPVGGFTARTSFFTLPAAGTISGALITGNASGLAVQGVSFLPGIYRVLMEPMFTQTATIGATYGLWVLRSDVADILTPGAQFTPLPTRAECYFPVCKGNVVSARVWREIVFTAEEPWKAVFGAVSALVDADIVDVHLDIECLAPLDLPTGM